MAPDALTQLLRNHQGCIDTDVRGNFPRFGGGGLVLPGPRGSILASWWLQRVILGPISFPISFITGSFRIFLVAFFEALIIGLLSSTEGCGFGLSRRQKANRSDAA